MLYFLFCIFLIIIALLPSFIWLLFYLRKDSHPESNRMILIVFFYGILAAFLAIFIELGISYFIEWGFSKELNKPILPLFYIYLLNICVAAPVVEETVKYLVVKIKVLKNSEMDEPLDIMLYMIISALGFAALENILIFFSEKKFFSALFLNLGEVLKIAGFRFISATFLHALSSGTLGFFLSLSFFKIKKRKILFAIGLFLAVVLHGIYNFLIINIDKSIEEINGESTVVNQAQFLFSFYGIILFISLLAIFVSYGFKRLKKIASVCKIK